MLLILRRNFNSNHNWRDLVLRLCSESVVDVYHPAQIEVVRITSDCEVDVYFNGYPLQGFRKVFWLSTPTYSTHSSETSSDDSFARAELEASLVAAFSLFPDLVFNRFFNFILRPELTSSIFMSALLRQVGWLVPRSEFRMLTDDIVKPLPSKFPLLTLLISPYNHLYWPYISIAFEKEFRADYLIDSTQKLMRTKGINFLNLVLEADVDRKELRLLGCTTEIPYNVHEECYADLLKEIILT